MKAAAATGTAKCMQDRRDEELVDAERERRDPHCQ